MGWERSGCDVAVRGLARLVCLRRPPPIRVCLSRIPVLFLSTGARAHVSLCSIPRVPHALAPQRSAGVPALAAVAGATDAAGHCCLLCAGCCRLATFCLAAGFWLLATCPRLLVVEGCCTLGIHAGPAGGCGSLTLPRWRRMPLVPPAAAVADRVLGCLASVYAASCASAACRS